MAMTTDAQQLSVLQGLEYLSLTPARKVEDTLNQLVEHENLEYLPGNQEKSARQLIRCPFWHLSEIHHSEAS